MFQEAISAHRVLNMLNMHINSLGKNLALNLLVYNDANSMLGNIVDSPSFAMVTFVGHSFLNSTHSIDIYNITLLVDSHVCGQRYNSMFSKRPREHVAGALLFPFVLVILANYWKMKGLILFLFYNMSALLFILALLFLFAIFFFFFFLFIEIQLTYNIANSTFYSGVHLYTFVPLFQ